MHGLNENKESVITLWMTGGGNKTFTIYVDSNLSQIYATIQTFEELV